MKKDRFKDYDDEVRSLVLDFENTVLKGESQFFDADELEVIIDYYFEVNDIKPLEKAVEYGEYLYPDSTQLRLRRAHLMMTHQKYDTALGMLRKLREMEPENTDIAYSMGVALGAVGESQKAIECFEEAATDGWQLGRIFSNMAEEYYKLKDYDRAIEHYRAAMETDSYDEVTIYNFYDVCNEVGRFEEAADFLNRFVKRNPYSKEGWYCLGCARRDLTLYELAVDAFEFAIAIDKTFVDAYVMLSQVQDFQGHLGEAVTTMLRALEFSENKDRIYRTVGSLYAREANFDTAIDYYRKALDENPADADAYAALAVCLLQQNDFVSALSHAKTALNLEAALHDENSEGGNPDVYCSAAMVYDAMGNFEEASQCFEKMVGTDLASEEQYQLYVQFLYAHKVYDIIIIFANESLDVYPHDIFYSTYLAASYFYTNRYNKARQVLPDVSPDLLGEICPEIMVHPLLGPLVPQSPWVEKKEER